MLKKPLKIALFCAIDYKVPLPCGVIYAPLEITANLAEGLSALGHQVTLFAKAGSKIAGTKIFSFDFLELKKIKTPNLKDRALSFYNQLSIAEVVRRQKEFNLIHLHYSGTHSILPLAKLSKIPTIVTLHDPITQFRQLALNESLKIKNLFFVSISRSQRQPFKTANFITNVYNGINLNDYQFQLRSDNYYFFSGRILPKKGVHLAVKVARRLNLNLKIAGPRYDIEAPNYFQQDLNPFFSSKIKYLGVLPPAKLISYYQRARALLFPIQWEEPFGLVMIEAMACGTPVIAFDRGSVPEVVKDGVTGFIVKTEKEMIKAVKKIDQIDRTACRAWVEKKFSLERMVGDYEKAYYRVLHLKS